MTTDTINPNCLRQWANTVKAGLSDPEFVQPDIRVNFGPEGGNSQTVYCSEADCVFGGIYTGIASAFNNPDVLFQENGGTPVCLKGVGPFSSENTPA